MKDFAVIGLGRFGSSVARTLASQGHGVLGIDSDECKIACMANVLAHVVQADATDEETLRALGVRNMDAVVVAIGHDIQASILVTVVLKELGVKQVIAKASSDIHGKVLLKVGADRVVFPEREMGARIAHSLVASNILDFIELSPEHGIVELNATRSMIGKTLRQLELRAKFGVNVLALKHGKSVKVSPRADDSIKEGDVLVIIGETEALRRLERLAE